jgi:L-ascorbate metabolism protein UlaG (beta-lactamase superfamily)
LIQAGGLNVLTDPVWSMKVGPFPWLGARRVQLPGVALADLPRIDVVLLSHDHYDHLDVPTLRQLMRRDAPRILCGLGVERILEIEGITGAEPYDWWQEKEVVPGIRAVFTPCRHFSGRGLGDQDSTLWGSFLLQTPGGSLYFAGDTGYGPHFTEVRARYGAPDCALLPIGCYEPRWFMRPYHMSPEDAVKAHVDLGARQSVGIHFGTFRLGDESYDRPVKDLARALAAHDLSSACFRALSFGAGLDLEPARRFQARPDQLKVVSPRDSW